MTQSELNRTVAAVTGESVREIAHRGFQFVPSPSDERTAEELILDWDQIDRQRNVALVEQPESEFVICY